jgi:hypothetical protein
MMSNLDCRLGSAEFDSEIRVPKSEIGMGLTPSVSGDNI